MCGRYRVYSEEDILDMIDIVNNLNRTPTEPERTPREIKPMDIAPVIGVDGMTRMRWGYPPFEEKGRPIINSKVERVHESPLFRDAIQSRRIVVPTLGFFEWTHDAKRRPIDKYLFRVPGDEIMCLAGIYDLRKTPNGMEARYAILTTEPNDSMRPFHDRMPVYVRQDEMDAWLHDAQFAEAVMRRTQPELEATRVEPPKPAQEQMSLF